MFHDDETIYCLIWGVVGVLTVLFGIRALISYRKRLSGQVRGKVVSSYFEEVYHYGIKYYYMYATIHYKLDGEIYQFEYRINSTKYYHFLNKEHFVDLRYDPTNPYDVQLVRLFENKGVRRIKCGAFIVFAVIIFMLTEARGIY